MNEKEPLLSPQSFQEIAFSPLRRSVEKHLKALPEGFGFSGITTCDIEKYDEFVRRCRDARCRPPSLYAYFARCLGVVLAAQPEMLAVRHKGKLFIPSRIDALVAVELTAYDGSQSVGVSHFADLGERTLDDIAQEMKARLRNAKRTVVTLDREPRRFVPRWAPDWWRDAVERLRDSRPSAQRRRAMENSCIQLSSTTQWMNGKGGWGVQLYNPMALSVTLSGSSRRPVADEKGDIAVHLCLDVALNFNHVLVDGAPATRFIAALIEEVESGRLLSEYPIVPRHSFKSKKPFAADSQNGIQHDFLLVPQASSELETDQAFISERDASDSVL